MTRVPSNFTSMEVLAVVEQENPNPSPALGELLRRCRLELSQDAPRDCASGGRERRVQRASIR
jgi:hypothetical protein